MLLALVFEHQAGRLNCRTYRAQLGHLPLPYLVLRNILIISVLSILFYSTFGPSWGRDVVNTDIMLTLFSFYGKRVPKRRHC
jgi:hypothetical protein